MSRTSTKLIAQCDYLSLDFFIMVVVTTLLTSNYVSHLNYCRSVIPQLGENRHDATFSLLFSSC